LGVYPDITLAEARQKRADAKRFLLLVVIGTGETGRETSERAGCGKQL
jgi:hypothetical protein